MNLRILEEAELEFTDAIARYQSIELGLGVRLKEEVKSTLPLRPCFFRIAPCID